MHYYRQDTLTTMKMLNNSVNKRRREQQNEAIWYSRDMPTVQGWHPCTQAEIISSVNITVDSESILLSTTWPVLTAAQCSAMHSTQMQLDRCSTTFHDKYSHWLLSGGLWANSNSCDTYRLCLSVCLSCCTDKLLAGRRLHASHAGRGDRLHSSKAPSAHTIFDTSVTASSNRSQRRPGIVNPQTLWTLILDSRLHPVRASSLQLLASWLFCVTSRGQCHVVS